MPSARSNSSARDQRRMPTRTQCRARACPSAGSAALGVASATNRPTCRRHQDVLPAAVGPSTTTITRASPPRVVPPAEPYERPPTAFASGPAERIFEDALEGEFGGADQGGVGAEFRGAQADVLAAGGQ